MGGTFQEAQDLDGNHELWEPGEFQSEKNCQICLGSGHACSPNLLVLLWDCAKRSGNAHGQFPGSGCGI